MHVSNEGSNVVVMTVVTVDVVAVVVMHESHSTAQTCLTTGMASHCACEKLEHSATSTLPLQLGVVVDVDELVVVDVVLDVVVDVVVDVDVDVELVV